MAAVVLMTAVLIICQIFPIKAADDENLYALSAVLMDGETGRVLYGKEAYKGRPNASTTKVMTCILALELAKGDDYVQVSGNAASQPQTRLGMREGQQFYLEDLLYSLMLKSHNDSAVAIAEHISGSVEAFAERMNEKAKELGCKDTHPSYNSPGSCPDHGVCNKKCNICPYYPDKRLYFYGYLRKKALFGT